MTFLTNFFGGNSSQGSGSSSSSLTSGSGSGSGSSNGSLRNRSVSSGSESEGSRSSQENNEGWGTWFWNKLAGNTSSISNREVYEGSEEEEVVGSTVYYNKNSSQEKPKDRTLIEMTSRHQSALEEDKLDLELKEKLEEQEKIRAAIIQKDAEEKNKLNTKIDELNRFVIRLRTPARNDFKSLLQQANQRYHKLYNEVKNYRSVEKRMGTLKSKVNVNIKGLSRISAALKEANKAAYLGEIKKLKDSLSKIVDALKNRDTVLSPQERKEFKKMPGEFKESYEKLKKNRLSGAFKQKLNEVLELRKSLEINLKCERLLYIIETAIEGLGWLDFYPESESEIKDPIEQLKSLESARGNVEGYQVKLINKYNIWNDYYAKHKQMTAPKSLSLAKTALKDLANKLSAKKEKFCELTKKFTQSVNKNSKS